MKALNLYGVQDLRCEEIKKPQIDAKNNVLVKVKAAGICGSDISRYRDLGPYVEGMTWGHEFSGIVEEIADNVKNIKVGDHVVIVPTLFEYEDYYYRSGQYARSDALHTIGAKEAGGFAEYVIVPEMNVVKLPKHVKFDAASLIEPSAVVLHGLHQVDFKIGHTVAVVGAGGTIGLLTLQWLKLMGASEIIAVDIDDKKLERTKDFGATHTINSKEVDTMKAIQDKTDGLGADLVIEAAGTPFTAATVFPYARKGGTVLFLGIPYGDVPMTRFSFEKILRSELTVKGSWASVTAPFPGLEWETTIKFLASGELDLDAIIEYRMPLCQGPEAFDKLIKKELDGKVILFPEMEE